MGKVRVMRRARVARKARETGADADVGFGRGVTRKV